MKDSQINITDLQILLDGPLDNPFNTHKTAQNKKSLNHLNEIFNAFNNYSVINLPSLTSLQITLDLEFERLLNRTITTVE